MNSIHSSITTINSIDKVKYPLELHLSNQQPNKENVLLFESCKNGSLTGVNQALQMGANVNYFHKQDDHKSSLHIAAENGYLNIVIILIDKGANVNSIAATLQTTPIILASQNNHFKIVQYLVEHGAYIHSRNCYGNTALHEAALQANYEIVKYLLENNANINQQNKKGSSPLHFICYSSDSKGKSSVNCLNELLKYNPQLDMKDDRGNTALLVCCTSGK